MYNSSMKYKWDNKNVRDYEIKEAKLNIACELKREGLPLTQISKFTKLSIE